jgi:SsrA-binding protein
VLLKLFFPFSCITLSKRINFAINFENMTENSTEKDITVNRKARHEYFILQTYEAGIVLVGTEVKALRQNKANLVDSYAMLQNGEVWLHNANISTYDQGSINNHDPVRKRKLLFNKSEIRKLIKAVNEKGNTLIPLRLYFSGGRVKVEIAVAAGKKQYDKREEIAKRDMKREMQRKFK